MNFKKMMSALLSLCMIFSLVACSGGNTASSTASTTSAADTGFTLTYPASMAAQGYTDLTLDAPPARIACMVAPPVFALHEMGVPIIAAPDSKAAPYPEDLQTTFIPSVRQEDFDIESVVALEPDLVIMNTSYADSHGATLSALNIPVYYVSAGHTVSYESVKEETQCLVDAFSRDDASAAKAQEIMGRFTTLEKRLEEVRPLYEGKTVMVLQSGSPTTHYIQSRTGTLGSMADMIGFTNVYENDTSSMVQIDLEQALGYQPDLMLCVGSEDTAEEHQALMEETYAQSPDYWNAIDAVKNGEVIYLPVTYIAATGICVIDQINTLIDIIAAHYAAEP